MLVNQRTGVGPLINSPRSDRAAVMGSGFHFSFVWREQ